MIHQCEATLEELLSEPIILKVMARDGVRTDDIRQLVQQMRVRTMRTRNQNQRSLDRDVARPQAATSGQASACGSELGI